MKFTVYFSVLRQLRDGHTVIPMHPASPVLAPAVILMQTKPISSKRIDLLDDGARARWAATFRISEVELRRAVRRFGTVPATVRACLGLPSL